MRNIIAAAIGLTLAIAATPGRADQGPLLIEQHPDPVCAQALELARAAYRSQNASLARSFILPSDFTWQSDFANGPNLDQHDGDGAHFPEISFFDRETELRSGSWGIGRVYWQVSVHDGKRLVIADWPFNWRGDWYTTHVIDAGITADEFEAQYQQARSQGDTAFDPLLGDDRWEPPLVLVDRVSRDPWLIDRGRSQWSVYTLRGGRMASPCSVQFGPPKETALTLLPQAVRQLAAALDEALGPGFDEGTLQPTARIRSEVELAWFNAALRPWALTDAPYNSKAEVIQGLSAWATVNKKRQEVYRKIEKGIFQSEIALTAYYRETFHFEETEASNVAKYALDHMVRAYFVFPKDRPFASDSEGSKFSQNRERSLQATGRRDR